MHSNFDAVVELFVAVADNVGVVEVVVDEHNTLWDSETSSVSSEAGTAASADAAFEGSERTYEEVEESLTELKHWVVYYSSCEKNGEDLVASSHHLNCSGQDEATAKP